MTKLRCPVCKQPFASAPSQALPFCSLRCRQIDLGRWLGEQYSVPVERLDDDEDDGESMPERFLPDER